MMNMAAIFTMVNLILFLDDMGLSKSYLMAFLSEKSVVILYFSLPFLELEQLFFKY